MAEYPDLTPPGQDPNLVITPPEVDNKLVLVPPPTTTVNALSPYVPGIAYGNYVGGLESGGDPNAKNPKSSATGFGQFTKGTWLDLIKRTRPDIAQGKTDDQLLELRKDPTLSRAMIIEYGKQNAPLLTKEGIPVNDQNLRLMHLGPGNALPILKASPDTVVDTLLSKDVLEANPTWKGMTAQQWIAANTKGGGGGGGAPASPGQPAVPAPPANALAFPPSADPLAQLDAKKAEAEARAVEQKKQTMLAMAFSNFAGGFRPVSYDPWKLAIPPDHTSPRGFVPVGDQSVRPMQILGRVGSAADQYFTAGARGT